MENFYLNLKPKINPKKLMFEPTCYITSRPVSTEITKQWIEKGNAILNEKYHEKWAKCVPIRLGDLYEGMELKATLDIVKELNAGCELDVAKGIIYGQGHSGMSFGLVCSMVKSFCDRGTEFVNFVR